MPGVKFALFSYCYAIKGASSQVQVLWEDHRNDLFTYVRSVTRRVVLTIQQCVRYFDIRGRWKDCLVGEYM